jgi:hypothetical protein
MDILVRPTKEIGETNHLAFALTLPSPGGRGGIEEARGHIVQSSIPLCSSVASVAHSFLWLIPLSLPIGKH